MCYLPQFGPCNLDSVIDIVTRLTCRIRVSNRGRGKRYFFFPNRADQLWGPLSRT